jgi:hypothetical protein
MDIEQSESQRSLPICHGEVTGGLSLPLDGDEITFDPSVTGTITLSNALPDLSADFIAGRGPTALTVDRSPDPTTQAFSIFTVVIGVEASVTGVTITGGRSRPDGTSGNPSSNLRPAGKVHRRLGRPDLNGVGRQVKQRSPRSRFRSTTSGSIRFTHQEKTLDSFAEEPAVFGIEILILLEAQNQADESLEGFAWFLRLELEPVITQVFSARIIPEQGIRSERRSQCHEHFEVAHFSSPLALDRDASTQHKIWLHALDKGLRKRWLWSTPKDLLGAPIET